MLMLALLGTLVGVNAQTYLQVTSRTKFANAEQDCIDRGGYLLIVNDEAEYITITTDLSRKLVFNAAQWIGNKKDDGNWNNWTQEPTTDCVRFNKKGIMEGAKCTGKHNYICEFDPKCEDITDPCECVDNCGWSSSNNECRDAPDSETICVECATLPQCKAGECKDNECPAEFDKDMTCQCTADCDTRGDCCSDVKICECALFTDPCDCTGECGWSTEKGECVLASESTTLCVECATLPECKPGKCMDNGCPEVFDPLMTCQCNDECVSRGNCCDDTQACECSKITEPCDCTGECGWSSKGNKCELATDSNTDCVECPTLPDCKVGECEDNECPADYDELMTCQCTVDCEEHESCCSDVDKCETLPPSLSPADCNKITDPCLCNNECGWSSQNNKCVSSKESQTDCSECPEGANGETCTEDTCEESDCPGYDKLRVCQCNDECKKYGNCCEDVDICKTPADPCKCKDKFFYDDVKYKRCTMVDDVRPWCYVENGPECDAAMESLVTTGEWYVYCDRCNCKDEFSFDAATYTRCTTEGEDTNGLSWCYVNGGEKCEVAEQSSENESEYLKYCDEEEFCECMDEFDWKGTTYYQCSVTETDGAPWCYVKGGDKCDIATESIDNPGMFYIICDRCECKDEFEYDGVTYDECTDVDDDKKWCYVRGDCEDAIASDVNPGESYKYCDDPCSCKDEFVWDGVTYTECAVTSRGGNPWCYVIGGDKCDIAVESSVNAGEFYINCDACECRESWKYDGVKYTECTTADDVRPWCFIKDGAMCPEAIPSEKEKNQFYLYCDNCECKEKFYWKGTEYTECTDVDDGMEWCYVKGDGACEDAIASVSKPGEFFKYCDPAEACECMDEFDWEGTTYYQCAVTETNGAPWCYVKGGDKCAEATESIENEGMFYIECDRCECKDEFEYKGNKYTECTDVDDDRKWCYVNSGTCAEAVASTVTVGEYYKYCEDDCDCKPEFVWDGVTYNWCTVTEKNGRPWCYVVGDGKCASAVESRVNAGEFYKYCDDCVCRNRFMYNGVEYNECTLTDDVRPWCYVKGGQFCEHATPSEVTQNQAYMYCDECECKDSWQWEGTTYTECTATEPGGRKWCYVKGEEKCELATPSMLNPGEHYVYCDGCECMTEFETQGTTYKGCTVTEEGGKPWCYVKGGFWCEDAKESEVDEGMFYKKCDECALCREHNCEGDGACLIATPDPALHTDAYTCPIGTPGDEMECDENFGVFCETACTDSPCDCMDSFFWQGVEYDDCTITKEGEKSWCYVKGGAACADAVQSEVKPDLYYLEDCGHPCDCKDSFFYEGVEYDQCTLTEDSQFSWCYVKGGDMCEFATQSDVNPDEWYIEDCGHPCDCLDEFRFGGQTYTDCATTSPGGYPWCYVEDGAQCDIATQSRKQNKKYYKWCEDPCKCKDSFEWEGTTYNECTVTGKGEKSWCYVVGGGSCPDAEQSSVNPNEYYIENCGHSCDCKEEFEYEGTTYTECTITSDSGRQWCYVQDGATCDYARESTVTVGEYYKHCGMYWMMNKCYNREQLPDAATKYDEFPSTPDAVWPRGDKDTKILGLESNDYQTTYATLARTYEDTKLILKFDDSCKISESTTPEPSGGDPAGTETRICMEKCEDHKEANPGSPCVAFAVEFKNKDCFQTTGCGDTKCILYSACDIVDQTPDGDKFTELFLVQEDVSGFEGKFNSPIMRMTLQLVLEYSDRFNFPTDPIRDGGEMRRRRIDELEGEVELLKEGVPRRRKVEEDIKTTTPPGACGSHCEDAESAECQKCCQNFDHEVNWLCGTENEAACCNEWGAQCFWERGEHNFNHGCKDCEPIPKWGKWWEQYEFAYMCKQLCTFMTGYGNFDCNYWQAEQVPTKPIEDRRRMMDLDVLEVDGWIGHGMPWDTHVCTFFKENPKKSAPLNNNRPKPSKDPWISGRYSRNIAGMTDPYYIDCYNDGYPYELLSNPQYIFPLAYKGGSEVYQTDGTFACARPSETIKGKKTAKFKAKSVWECARKCQDRREDQCKLWKYSTEMGTCEFVVDLEKKTGTVLAEFKPNPKDNVISGDRACYYIPDPSVDFVNGDPSSVLPPIAP